MIQEALRNIQKLNQYIQANCDRVEELIREIHQLNAKIKKLSD